MPKLVVDVSVDAMPRVLRDFTMLVGHARLKELLDGVHADVSRRKVTSIGLLNRYAVALGLRRAYAYSRSTGRALSPIKDPEAYSACTFALAAVSLASVLSEKGKERLDGMLRSCLDVKSDARRLEHELSVAAHFSQNGWDVTPIDIEGAGNFDYVVRRGDVEVDVECKTINADKGNAIHMLDAMNFMEMVGPRLVEKLGSAHWTIDIVFDVGLPTDSQGQVSLSKTILSALRSDASRHDFPGGSVALRRDAMPAFRSDEEMHDFAIQREYEVQERLNGHACSFYDRRQLVILGTSSRRPSRVVPYTYQEVRKGCGQLTKGRAGFVWTRFVDITDAEMQQLAESTSHTGLDTISTKIFANDSRRHVSVLGYSGEPTLRKWVESRPGQRVNSYMQRGLLKTHRSNRTTYPIPLDFPTANRA